MYARGAIYNQSTRRPCAPMYPVGDYDFGCMSIGHVGSAGAQSRIFADVFTQLSLKRQAFVGAPDDLVAVEDYFMHLYVVFERFCEHAREHMVHPTTSRCPAPDLFLWHVPEDAVVYATEQVRFELVMTATRYAEILYELSVESANDSRVRSQQLANIARCVCRDVCIVELHKYTERRVRAYTADGEDVPSDTAPSTPPQLTHEAQRTLTLLAAARAQHAFLAGAREAGRDIDVPGAYMFLHDAYKEAYELAHDLSHQQRMAHALCIVCMDRAAADAVDGSADAAARAEQLLLWCMRDARALCNSEHYAHARESLAALIERCKQAFSEVIVISGSLELFAVHGSVDAIIAARPVPDAEHVLELLADVEPRFYGDGQAAATDPAQPQHMADVIDEFAPESVGRWIESLRREFLTVLA